MRSKWRQRTKKCEINWTIIIIVWAFLVNVYSHVRHVEPIEYYFWHRAENVHWMRRLSEHCTRARHELRVSVWLCFCSFNVSRTHTCARFFRVWCACAYGQQPHIYPQHRFRNASDYTCILRCLWYNTRWNSWLLAWVKFLGIPLNGAMDVEPKNKFSLPLVMKGKSGKLIFISRSKFQLTKFNSRKFRKSNHFPISISSQFRRSALSTPNVNCHRTSVDNFRTRDTKPHSMQCGACSKLTFV